MPELTVPVAEARADAAALRALASPALTAATTFPAAALAAFTPWFSVPAAVERQDGTETAAICAANDCTD